MLIRKSVNKIFIYSVETLFKIFVNMLNTRIKQKGVSGVPKYN